jgi:hypothetical protein
MLSSGASSILRIDQIETLVIKAVFVKLFWECFVIVVRF